MEYESCPLCAKLFSVVDLIAHVDRCPGASADDGDADLEFARRLQEEENMSHTPIPKPEKPKANNPPPMSDEDLARMLQQQEQEESKKK
jgi:hypothetical protein